MVTMGSSRLTEQGILLEDTPSLTRLQLRSWVSWPARVGLAIPASCGLLVLWAVARALSQGGIQNRAGVILATVVGIILVVGPYLAARWTRYGVRVVVTPERLLIKRHWTRGGKAHELALGQVRSVRGRQTGIAIESPWNVVEIETGLTPEQRTAVVDLLKTVVQNHLQRGSGASGASPVAQAFACTAPADAPALEFGYRSGFVVPLLETVGALVLAAVIAYIAVHNDKGTDFFWRSHHIRMSRAQTAYFLWSMAGLFVVFAVISVRALCTQLTRPGRLVLRPDRLEFVQDGARSVCELPYGEIEAITVSPAEGTQRCISIAHAHGTLDIARSKLSRSADFEVIRDAITQGFERSRAHAHDRAIGAKV